MILELMEVYNDRWPRCLTIRPSGLLNRLVLLVLVSNYYLDYDIAHLEGY